MIIAGGKTDEIKERLSIGGKLWNSCQYICIGQKKIAKQMRVQVLEKVRPTMEMKFLRKIENRPTLYEIR